jgi:hypothetical protein
VVCFNPVFKAEKSLALPGHICSQNNHFVHMSSFYRGIAAADARFWIVPYPFLVAVEIE